MLEKDYMSWNSETYILVILYIIQIKLSISSLNLQPKNYQFLK